MLTVVSDKTQATFYSTSSMNFAMYLGVHLFFLVLLCTTELDNASLLSNNNYFSLNMGSFYKDESKMPHVSRVFSLSNG